MGFSSAIILFVLCMSLVQLTTAQQFNMFKDYSHEAVKPGRYAAKRTKHDISEYLSPRQKAMMTQRNGPITPANSFDSAWTGFSPTGPIAVTRKLLRGISPASDSPNLAAVSGITSIETTSEQPKVESSERISPTHAMLKHLFSAENLLSYIPYASNAQYASDYIENMLEFAGNSIQQHFEMHTKPIHQMIATFSKKAQEFQDALNME